MTAFYSARSHIGKIRKQNEDNLYADGVFMNSMIRDCPFAIDGCTEMPIVLAVCDGMGGEENGEAASMLAVEMLEKASDRFKTCTYEDMHELVQNYVNDVNNKIHSLYQNGKRVGTTLALTVIDNKGIRCFNIGDTKVFVFAQGKLTQISNDHTLVNDKIKCKLITKEDAKADKDRHKLTRCIGIGNNCNIDSYPVIDFRQRLLICSDGLTDMVTEDDIEMLLMRC